MIIRNKILQIASNKHLNPSVVEKDYVLGWLLAGISQNATIKELLVFKGGTCLKKCYFETYRSSEDLDFSIYNKLVVTEELLQKEFRRIATWVSSESGIEIPLDKIEFWSIVNPKGIASYQGKIHYKGPISPSSKYAMPKIKLDITIDEIIVDKPRIVEINHEYNDIPINNINLMGYSYIEVFAEKIRALKERTRPRDLYDVISFYRRPESFNLASEIKRILKEKCAFKFITFPKLEDLELHKNECEQGWKEQLEHQIPVLPPFSCFWEELSDFFAWLNDEYAKTELKPILHVEESNGKISLRNLNIKESYLSILNLIQFSTANHLCIEINYKAKSDKRIVLLEPYSLRINNNKICLYGIKHNSASEIEVIEIIDIIKIKILAVSFKPQYKIEFIPEIITV